MGQPTKRPTMDDAAEALNELSIEEAMQVIADFLDAHGLDPSDLEDYQ